jgi:hypothetical protein
MFQAKDTKAGKNFRQSSTFFNVRRANLNKVMQDWDLQEKDVLEMKLLE